MGRAEGTWRRAFGCPGVGMHVYGRESRRAGCRRLTPSVISWRPGPRRGEGPNWICPGSDQERASGTQSPQALRPPRETWVKCVRSLLLIQDRSPPSPHGPRKWEHEMQVGWPTSTANKPGSGDCPPDALSFNTFCQLWYSSPPQAFHVNCWVMSTGKEPYPFLLVS